MVMHQGCGKAKQTTYESAAKLPEMQAGKDPQAGKDAGDAQAGQCVRDALLADCTSPWRPSSACRTSSTAGDLELKDISFPF